MLLKDKYWELKCSFDEGYLLGEILHDYLDDEEFENDLYSQAIHLIKLYMQGILEQSEYFKIFVALSFIAIKYYDGGFWPYVTEKIYYNGNFDKSEQVFHSKLRVFIREFFEYYANEEGVDISSIINSKRIIDLPTIQSIIPAKYVYNYFLFCYDIYVLNLQCSLKPYKGTEKHKLIKDLRQIFDALKNKMNDDTDELNISGIGKTYVLIKATKTIVESGFGIESLLSVTETIIRMIDKYYWDKDRETKSSYFEKPFQEWVKTVSHEDKERHINDARNRTEFVRWVPKFVLNNVNHCVYLETRNDSISDVYEKDKLKMLIYNDNKLVLEDNHLHTVDMIGGYRLSSKLFKLPTPLGKLRYCLMCGEDVLYDSQDKLYRKFLIFNQNGNEIRNHSDYEGTVGFVFNSKTHFAGHFKKYENEEYTVYYSDVNSKTKYLVDGESIDFISTPEEGIFGKVAPNVYINYDESKKVYHEIGDIVISFFENKEDITVVINKKRKRLVEMENVIITTNNSLTIARILFSNMSEGYYNIYFEILGTKKKLGKEFEFILDKAFNFKTALIEGNKYNYSIESNIFDFEDDVIELEKNWQIVVEAEESDLGKLINYILLFDRPIFKTIDNWKEFTNYLWHEDLYKCDKIEIFYSDIKEVNILNNSKKMLISNVQISKINGKSILDSNNLKTFSSYPFIYVEVIDSNDESYYLRVAFKLIFERFKIKYIEPGQLSVTPQYIGLSKIKLSISNRTTSVLEKEVNSDEETIISIEDFVRYSIVATIEDYSNLIPVTKLLKTDEFINFDISKIENQRLEIRSAVSCIYIKDKQTLKEFDIKKTYIEIGEKIEENIYVIKKMYIIKQVDGENKKLKYSKLENLTIEFTSKITQHGHCQAVLFSEGDLLLLNKTKNGIYNGDLAELFPLEDYRLKVFGR